MLAGVVSLFVVTALVAFRCGRIFQANTFASDLNSVQASLWFNHLQTFEEIENDLLKGCNEVALEVARNGIDQELGLLSSFAKENANSPALKRMAEQDPKIIARLSNFKSRHGNSWVAPICPPPSNPSFNGTPGGAR